MIHISITNDILGKLLEIQGYVNRFEYCKVPIHISNRLRKNSKKRSSYASVKIEGNPLTEQQAEAVLESSDRHFLKPEQEVRNYYAALQLSEKLLKDKTPFSLDLILDIQKQVVKGESKEKTGLRGAMPPGVLFAVYDSITHQADYIPPQAADIKPLLQELIDYVNNSDDHPIIKAAIVHYQLVTIHPFEDGNGRTARILSDYILDMYGYGFGQIGSLEEYFAYDVDEYYNSLQMGLPPLFYEGRENPPHPEIWINYFLRMMILHGKKVVELTIQAENLQADASFSYLTQKEKAFLQFLLKKNFVQFMPVDLAKLLNVSNRTIINWCVGLVKNGFLTPNLVNQRIRSYSVTEFAKTIKQL